MTKAKHSLRRVLSVFLAVVLCFGALPFVMPMEAEAATAGSYYYRVTLNVTDNADGWDVSNIILYYKQNNGTGTQGSVTLSTSAGAVGDGTHNFTGTIPGFPSGYTHEYSFGGGFTWRTYEYNLTIQVGASSSSSLTTVYTATYADSSSAFSAARGTFGGTSLSMRNTPAATSVTFNSGSTSIAVPTDGANDTYTYTATVKDQYGVNWYQNPTFTVNNAKVSMSSGGTLTVRPTSNAADNYTVTVTASRGNASATRNVTIRVFDYNVVFNNYDGTQLSEQTVNYGESATPPADPTRPYDTTNHYVFSGWNGTYQNLTSGAQDKTVTATYNTVAHTYTETVVTEPDCIHAGEKKYTCECGYSYTASTPADPSAHNWSAWETVTEADCENAGSEKRTCSICGDEQTRVVDALGHDWGEWETVTAATCMQAGSQKRVCATCGTEDTQTIPVDPNAHDWGEWNTVREATCQVEGLRQRVCKNNSQHTDSEAIPIDSNAHTWGEWTILQAATCTTEGSRTHTCTSCGTTATEVIPVDENAHDWGEWTKTKDATCSAPGEEQRVCSRDASHTETRDTAIAPDAHSWGEWTTVKPATCTETGTRQRVCAYNNQHIDSETIAIDENAHAWGNWEITDEPTCTEKGEQTRVCANNPAHTETQELAALGHTTEHKTIASTCTVAGVEYDECTRCHNTFNEVLLPLAAHSWGEWTVDKAATCSAEGQRSHTCSVCTTTESEPIAINPDAHKYDAGVVNPVPNCINHGVRTYTCQYNSEHTYTENVPLDPDNHVGGTYLLNDKEPTCEEDGYTGDTYCSSCHTKLADGTKLAATGHDWGEWETVTPAGCETAGLQRRICANDASHVEEKVLEATGHAWGDWETTTNPTCTDKGEQTRVCALNSNHTETQELAALGHNLVHKTVASTCTVAGVEYDECTRCHNTFNEVLLPLAAHSWGEWTVKTAATCITKGSEKQTCSVCGDEQTRETETDPNNHVGETEIRGAVTETCGEDGYTGDTYCLDCGNKIADGTTIPATNEHTWGDWETVTPAGCETTGVQKHTCSVCGETAEGTIPATGHAWDDGVINPASTCKTHGTITYTCLNDPAHTKTEKAPLDANNHEGGTYVKDAKEPTCTENGYTGDICCAGCDAILEEGSVIPHTGHVYNDGVVIKPATETEKGIIRYTCEVCGDWYDNEIPALEHTHTGGEATCVSRAICAICGEPYGEYDNTNHKHTEAIPDIAPTCTTDGQTGGVRCADCGAIIEEPTIVPATGHTDADGDGKCDIDGATVIPEGGYDFDTFRCKMCDKYEANKDIPFVGFIYTIVHFFVHLAHYIGYLT